MQKKLLALLVVGFGVLLAGRLLTAQNAPQPEVDLSDYRGTMIRMLGEVVDSRSTLGVSAHAIEAVSNSDDPLYLPALIDLAFFARGGTLQAPVFTAISQLSGENFADWETAFEWASENDLDLPPHYDEFKGLVMSTIIDPEFARFFQPGSQETANINMLEAVWGGVRVDGIPSLVNARQITPEEAVAEGERLQQFCNGDDCAYPAPDEFVFGVNLNGDARAYPLRLLNWHEMFNDVIGSVPVYDAPDGELICNFRAPLPFTAVARQGMDWVQIVGESAGCPEDGGWVSAVDSADLLWTDAADWDAALEALPDLTEDDAEALAEGAGIMGTVDGMPVMLAYCTLCGAGVLYDVTIPDLMIDGESQGETVLEFGSTGMLMRSNKLMYDRNTDTVWNAITGEPAFGPLATSGIQLELLPVVVIDWATWQEQHPDTSVLSLDTGFRRDYTNGAAYSEYFNNSEFIMFPVWQQDTSENENKEMVFALTIDGTPKAYPLRRIVPEVVTNDTIGDTDLVLVTEASPERDFFEPGGAAVRAYDRGELTFTPGDSANEVVDNDGNVWTVTENALVSADGDELPRLGGHLAFWFGWYSFNPDTLVYGGEM